jgi:transcriptional regulator with XRE-family HTH domain
MVGKSSEDHDLPFGAALHRLRQAASLTQERLGLEAGVQHNFVSLIELGHNQPMPATISKLARALGMQASELVAVAEAEVPTSRRRRPPR